MLVERSRFHLEPGSRTSDFAGLALQPDHFNLTGATELGSEVMTRRQCAAEAVIDFTSETSGRTSVRRKDIAYTVERLSDGSTWQVLMDTNDLSSIGHSIFSLATIASEVAQ